MAGEREVTTHAGGDRPDKVCQLIHHATLNTAASY